MSFLKVEALSVDIGGKRLLENLDLEIMAGELFGLIGPNGAGKSTLVKAIMQLLPYSGTVSLDGQPLAQLSARARAQRLAYLSQDDRLQWPISVQNLVALGRHPYRGSWWRGAGLGSAGLGGRKGGNAQAQADERAIEQAMQATDIWSLRERRADELSGGERARARLARVLAVEADVLFADEPVAALDPMHQLRVMELLRARCQAGQTVVVVLHDLTLASRFCDRLLLLDQGVAVASGQVETVLSPAHLASVYSVQAIIGEHQDGDKIHRYIVPWSCQPLNASKASSA
ncbi:ABC transporter ATP-binding protein [Lamprobacter modestohalophilus]|uniref:ABC transporter ATP-binding protein n=1 Tax=Lamprobacter modestohalophilus TaxID=1064514 RepID=UPI002ADED408|nr:ABC transporter ATP-binding protein [Lamprobacter modestohalophilus]MEA1049066.1 ABC transporter ATP-binding protein [Lamprobacter modestohalophilus]